MDASMTDILEAIDASTLSGSDTTQNAEKPRDDSSTQSPSKSRWRGLSALKAQASMQDKLLEK